MPWVRLSRWRDMRAREVRVGALLERWDSDVSAARSDPGMFSRAFEVVGTCADDLREAMDGSAMMTTSRGCREPNWSYWIGSPARPLPSESQPCSNQIWILATMIYSGVRKLIAEKSIRRSRWRLPRGHRGAGSIGG
jgi:hypothetical protein